MPTDLSSGYRFDYSAIVASAAEPDSRPISLEVAGSICRTLFDLQCTGEDDVLDWATWGLKGHVLSTATDGRELFTTARALAEFLQGVSLS